MAKKIGEHHRHAFDDTNISLGYADVRMDNENWFGEAHINTAAVGPDGMFKSKEEAEKALAGKLRALADQIEGKKK